MVGARERANKSPHHVFSPETISSVQKSFNHFVSTSPTPLCTYYHPLTLVFLPRPPPPKHPPRPLLPASLHVPKPLPALPPPPPRPAKPHPQPHGHEGDDQQRLHGLCEDGPAEQEETDAAEDDGGGDPRLVGPLEVGFAHAQHDEAQDGEEVEGVARDAVEGDEAVEAACEDVDGGEARVQRHGGDGREEEARVWVGEAGCELARLRRRSRRGRSAQANRAVLFPQPNGPEEGRHVALLPRGVDEAARGEGCGVEGAEAAPRDEEGEDESARGAEDLQSEGDGDGVGGLDDVGGEDEEVGYVGEDVAEDDEGEGGVDDAREVAGGVLELGGYVVDLVSRVSILCRGWRR